MPMRDRGMDLIAYVDLEQRPARDATQHLRFAARPIQLKTVNGKRFIVDTKYAKFPDLILVHVWHLEDPARTVAYAQTYPEALSIAEQMGWTTTETWRTRGHYNMSVPSKTLIALLELYRMTPERWRALVLGASAQP